MRSSPPKRRNAAATRQAILDSARAAFARSGYDGAGVREIAAGAGVTAMLVNRYFGSKERLFAEVAAATSRNPSVLTPEALQSPHFAEHLAAAIVKYTQAGETPLEGFLIMLRSASSTRAAEIGREEIEKGHQRVMTAATNGPNAPQRAAIMLSLVAGLQVMRQMIGLHALADANPATLTKILTPVIEQLVGAGPSRLARKKRS